MLYDLSIWQFLKCNEDWPAGHIIESIVWVKFIIKNLNINELNIDYKKMGTMGVLAFPDVMPLLVRFGNADLTIYVAVEIWKWINKLLILQY